MGDRDRLRQAVDRLDVDPLDAAQERVRQAAEQRTTAPERRSIMATIRALVKPILAAFGVRLP